MIIILNYYFLPSWLLQNPVFFKQRLHPPPHLADDGSEDLAQVSQNRQGEGDPDDGEEDAKQSAMEGDWGDVPIADSGEDGGGEEDRLNEIPTGCVVGVLRIDTKAHRFRQNCLVL